MAQLTIYLPDAVAAAARRGARRAKKSLSSYVAAIVEREARGRAWPKDLQDVLTRGNGDLVEPDDPPPEDVAELK